MSVSSSHVPSGCCLDRSSSIAPVRRESGGSDLRRAATASCSVGICAVSAEDRFAGTRSRGNVSVKLTGQVELHLLPAQRPGQPHQVTAFGVTDYLAAVAEPQFLQDAKAPPFHARIVDQRRRVPTGWQRPRPPRRPPWRSRCRAPGRTVRRRSWAPPMSLGPTIRPQ